MAIAIMAMGNKHKNKFSRGFLMLLINTKEEIEKAIRVDISKNPNWYPLLVRITSYTLNPWEITAIVPNKKTLISLSLSETTVKT